MSAISPAIPTPARTRPSAIRAAASRPVISVSTPKRCQVTSRPRPTRTSGSETRIETEPEPLDEEQEPDGHERGCKDAVGRPETFLGHATASPSAGPQHERPGSDVEDDPEPAGGGERDEAGPHDGRRHSDPARDPGSDSGKEPVLRVERWDPV